MLGKSSGGGEGDGERDGVGTGDRRCTVDCILTGFLYALYTSTRMVQKSLDTGVRSVSRFVSLKAVNFILDSLLFFQNPLKI